MGLWNCGALLGVLLGGFGVICVSRYFGEWFGWEVGVFWYLRVLRLGGMLVSVVSRVLNAGCV